MGAELLRAIDEVDEMIQKARIVRGENSERREWAGSTWEDQDIPDYAPNGTDYEPKKEIRRVTGKKPFKKAVEDMSTDELERELSMRKSGVPNAIKAEAEIMSTIPGVEKAICPDCDGTGQDVVKKSVCGTCHSFGYCFVAPDEEAANRIDAISKKYNVGNDYFQKAQKENKGGGVGDSDPTPAKAGPMTPVEEDFTGKKVAKANPDDADMIGKLAKLEGEVDKMKSLMKAEMDEMDEEPGEEPGEEEAGKGKSVQNLNGAGKCKKSMGDHALLTVLEGQQALMKGVRHLLAHQGELEKGIRAVLFGQADEIDMLATSVELTGEMYKGLVAGSQPQDDVNKSTTAPKNGQGGAPRPARAPRAVSSGGGITVLQKSFVDQAPGSEGDGGSKYDFDTLKKGATQMCLDSRLPLGERLHRRVVIGFDHGMLPDEKVLKSLEAYIDKYGLQTE